MFAIIEVGNYSYHMKTDFLEIFRKINLFGIVLFGGLVYTSCTRQLSPSQEGSTRARPDYIVRTLDTLKQVVEVHHQDLNRDGITTILIDTSIYITDENYQLLPITIRHSMEIVGLGTQEDYVKGVQLPVIAHQTPYKTYHTSEGKGKNQPIFLIPYKVSPTVTFRGLDFEGPIRQLDINNLSPYMVGKYLPSEKSLAILSHKKVTIEQCSFHHWNAAIQMSGSHGSVINKNYIYNNSMHLFYDSLKREGLGYGVLVSGDTRDILITGNLFSGNRHDVSSEGHGNSSYTAKYNVITGNSHGSNFDVHSIKDGGDTIQTAGKRLIVEKNIWYKITSSHRPIAQRGAPTDICIVANNYFGDAKAYFSEKNTIPGYAQVKNDADWDAINVRTVYKDNYWGLNWGDSVDPPVGKDSASETYWVQGDKFRKINFISDEELSKYPTYIDANTSFKQMLRKLNSTRLHQFLFKEPQTIEQD